MIEDLIIIPILIGLIIYGINCIKTSESNLEKSFIPLYKISIAFYGIALIIGTIDLIYLLLI